MTHDELQAIKARAHDAMHATPDEVDRIWAAIVCEQDVPALIAEIERLREATKTMAVLLPGEVVERIYRALAIEYAENTTPQSEQDRIRDLREGDWNRTK